MALLWPYWPYGLAHLACHTSGMHNFRFVGWLFLPLALLATVTAGATTVERLSFAEMTDSSEAIVSGQIADSWSAWDSEHKYIWTHYRILVSNTLKGEGSLVEIAEPGGVMGNVGMQIGGGTLFQRGETVLVFLQRMPNGYLRTAGLGQGKYTVDAAGRLRGAILKDVEVLEKGGIRHGVSLEGLTLADAATQISGYVRTAGARRIR